MPGFSTALSAVGLSDTCNRDIWSAGHSANYSCVHHIELHIHHPLNKTRPSLVYLSMDPKKLPIPADEAQKLAEQAQEPEHQQEARQAEEETEVNPMDTNLERSE